MRQCDKAGMRQSGDAFNWLVARPIAHRGLHDAAKHIIENSLAAARAAIAKDYAIECDVQLSRDDEAIVFHDETLMRLVGIDRDITACDAAELTGLRYSGSGESIATFANLLTAIAGRVPLIAELKSRFDGDLRLPARVVALAKTYAGPLAFQSFDPQMLAQLWALGTRHPRGLIAEADYRAEDWPRLTTAQRAHLASLDLAETQIDFLAWNIRDALPPLARRDRTERGLKLLAWTVRSADMQVLTQEWADQIIFEGFEP